ncbi:MAG: amidohydrolase family protein [Candidatus Ratteibacteria bacterium]|nr:amidohydrolase family protein [Candidatus Ratteibacteria bacterium]
MFIDVHTHILTTWGEEPFTEQHLIKRMEELKIDKFVVLPIIGPEGNYFYVPPEQIIEVYKRHSDRVIPFCNIDPRAGSNSPETDFSFLIDTYKRAGCKGVGEITANMYIDDPRCINLFRQLGKAELPVLFHLYNKIGGSYGLVDDIHLPRLEKVLKKCPDTIFIGHAMAFWSEISADVSEETRGGYPKGEIKAPGRLQKLLKKYPNLYGDLSAGSGFNAITRDITYGYKFLREFHTKLLFGTDLCHIKQEVPIVDYFKQIKEQGIVTEEEYENITHKNVERVLKL